MKSTGRRTRFSVAQACRLPCRGIPFLCLTSAFTLIELLVVLAIIGLLASLLLPALVKAKIKGQSIVCVNNLRGLTQAWLMYAHDHDDALAPNHARKTQAGFDFANAEGSWVLGNAVLDATTSNIQAGVLFQYASAVGVYRCPSDKSTVRDQPEIRRARSYAMEHWLNMHSDQGTGLDFANDQPLNLKKYTQFASVNPGPSRVFVFTDEHPICIDDGVFSVASPWQFPEVNPSPRWVSLPSERHGGADNFSFADGHVEAHRWLWQRNPKRYLSAPTFPVNAKDAEDIRWVQNRIPGARR